MDLGHLGHPAGALHTPPLTPCYLLSWTGVETAVYLVSVLAPYLSVLSEARAAQRGPNLSRPPRSLGTPLQDPPGSSL